MLLSLCPAASYFYFGASAACHLALPPCVHPLLSADSVAEKFYSFDSNSNCSGSLLLLLLSTSDCRQDSLLLLAVNVVTIAVVVAVAKYVSVSKLQQNNTPGCNCFKCLCMNAKCGASYPGWLPSNNSLRLPVEQASSALMLCRLSSLALNIGYNGFNYNNAD